MNWDHLIFYRKKKINAFGNKELICQLKKDYSYIFSGLKYPGLPKIKLNKVQDKFNYKNISIIPIHILHHKLNILGYRIANLTYITDAKTIPEIEQEKIYGSDVLIINCLQIKEHISHLNLEEALNLIKRLNVKKVYFTHISHFLGRHKDINKILPKNVELAYDNLEINLWTYDIDLHHIRMSGPVCRHRWCDYIFILIW